MDTLDHHYRLLLGLDDSWQVVSVDLLPEHNRVEIRIRHLGGKVACPECQGACSIADHAPERQWRHLDVMQFETRILSSTPRSRCETCGVKTIAVPWASKHGRFTLMFEAFAVKVLTACSSVAKAAQLLRLNWESTHDIMERAVERGLIRRNLEEVEHVGIDEKSFGKGQDYVSVMTDLDGSRVLEVVPKRTESATKQLWESIPEENRKNIQAVAMDMWAPYVSATEEAVPRAEIVHDKFHVAKHLNEAVDKVRRSEHKTLMQAGDETLKGTRRMWNYNEKNLPEKYADDFAAVKQLQLKTSRAWAIKESFQVFWSYAYAGHARRYFKDWYSWASRSKLKPIIKAAKMIKRHLDRIVTYFKHRITNAHAEAFNSRIQWLKSAARGFRSFRNYRTRILFFCGRLDMLPEGCH